jgi:ribosomal protein L12E/L44/L45/RPP1/RPP2
MDPLGDAQQRFLGAFSQIRSTPALSAGTIQAIQRDTLQQVLDAHNESDDARTQALTNHLTANTPLTRAIAQPLAAAAVVGKSNADASAQAAQQATSLLSGLTGSASLTLSQPIPLGGWERAVAAIITAGIVVTAVVLIAIAHSTGVAEYVALGVLGGLGWLGTVLFVMGYGNVSLTGSSGSPSGGAGGGG